MKRQLLHIIIPMTALALSACGTMPKDSGQVEFEYPQSDGFSGNFLAGKAAQIENSTDYAAKYLLRAHELDTDNKELRRRAFLALISDGRIADAEDIARHADAWIKGHRATFDGWLEEARAAAK